MRKSFKILTILFAVILLCGIVAVSAMAADENPPSEPEYYFQVYDIKSGETKHCNNPDDFSAELTGKEDGPKEIVITLLKDIEETESTSIINIGYYANSENPMKIYWDLNGHYYSLVRKSNKATVVSMDVNDYVELNIYSSRPGGRIFNYNEDKVDPCNALFWLRYSNASLNLGKMDVPVTFNHETGKYSKEITSYDGDNLSTYSGALVGLTNRDGNDQSMKVTINGGTYGHNRAGVSLIAITANETDGAESSLIAKDAKFISAYERILSVNGAATGTSSFENCTFYSSSSIFSVSAIAHKMTFKGCAFVGNVGTLSGNITVDDCKASSMYAFSQNSEIAHINQTEFIDVITYNFTYNGDGSVNAESYGAKTVNKEKVLYLFQTISEDTECATIVWDAEAILGAGEKITEKWLIGETPISPIPIPEATNVYRYAWVKGATVDNVTTYTLTAYANFGIKANLTLSEAFAFNIYVPADVWENVISTKIEDAPVTAEKTAIDGKDYYLISHGINANVAKDSFDFAIELKGYNGTEFTQSYTFSIPDYMGRVLNGEYTTEARDLIKATQNYIDAVYNYANSKSNEIDTTYVTTKTGTTNGKFSNVKINLALTDSIVFQFTADTSTNMTFKIPTMENGKFIYKTVEAGSVTSYDVKIPVRFLNDGIIIEAEGKSGTYYIDDYINATSNHENQNLVALTNAIGTYAQAANVYAKAEGNQTPVVKITVADKEITKIVYNSDDAKATAEKLAEIMTAKGHTIEAVLDTEMKATANAILLSVIEPTMEYDYRITVDGTNLVINCSFASFVDEATDYFITDFIKYADKTVNFSSDFEKDYNTAKIYYSDFGAVGNAFTNKLEDSNDYTDDFFAIKATHDFANLTKRHTVYADDGATYYIHETRRLNEDGKYGSVQTIQIKTDVNWGNAKFIINDTDISSSDKTNRHSGKIFNVASDYASTTISDDATLEKLANIGEGTTKIDFAPGFDALLTIYNSNHKVYRRKGYASAEGANQHELILIDKDGNVDESTPFMFDYETVTSVTVQRIDKQPTTISGGTFYTWASRVNMYTPVYANYQAFNPETGELLFDKDDKTTTPTPSDKSGYVHKYRWEYEKDKYKYTYALNEEDALANLGLSKKPANTETTSWSDLGIFLKTTNDGYFARSINVSRSNTTVQNVQHYIKYEISVAEQNAGITYTAVNEETGENIAGSEVKIAYGGAPYNGFLYASNTTDILFKDCVLTGRRGYSKVSNSDDSGMTGTYDFGANLVNNIILDGCLQSNFYMQYANDYPGMVTTEPIVDDNGKITGFYTLDGDARNTGYEIEYNGDIPVVKPATDSLLSMSYPNKNHGGRMCWGIGGTNYCKNMIYKNSVLSRYDAHCGLLNGAVTGTTINFFAMVGKGEFLIEDVTWITSALEAGDETNNSLIFLRNDYGSPWDGTITIKNTVAHNYALSEAEEKNGTPNPAWLIYHRYANWDFGYTAHFPNIIVDNLEFTNTNNVTFLSHNWIAYDTIHEETVKYDGDTKKYGTYTNLNTVVPPEFIKIINNNSHENYTIPDDMAFFSSTYIAVDTNSDETPEEEKYPAKVEETPTLPVD